MFNWLFGTQKKVKEKPHFGGDYRTCWYNLRHGLLDQDTLLHSRQTPFFRSLRFHDYFCMKLFFEYNSNPFRRDYDNQYHTFAECFAQESQGIYAGLWVLLTHLNDRRFDQSWEKEDYTTYQEAIERWKPIAAAFQEQQHQTQQLSEAADAQGSIELRHRAGMAYFNLARLFCYEYFYQRQEGDVTARPSVKPSTPEVNAKRFLATELLQLLGKGLVHYEQTDWVDYIHQHGLDEKVHILLKAIKAVRGLLPKYHHGLNEFFEPGGSHCRVYVEKATQRFTNECPRPKDYWKQKVKALYQEETVTHTSFDQYYQSARRIESDIMIAAIENNIDASAGSFEYDPFHFPPVDPEDIVIDENHWIENLFEPSVLALQVDNPQSPERPTSRNEGKAQEEDDIGEAIHLTFCGKSSAAKLQEQETDFLLATHSSSSSSLG